MEAKEVEERATFPTLPGTGKDVRLVGFLHTLSKVGICHFDLALMEAYVAFFCISFWLCHVAANVQ